MILDMPKPAVNVDKSPTLKMYKNLMIDCLSMYADVDQHDLSKAVDYSINKRLHDTHKVKLENNYTKHDRTTTLLNLSDWIASKEPIVTAHGTMFRKHGDVPNPLGTVIQLFLDKRVEDKNIMLTFPKGSENYEKYNLFQQLDKIDCNGLVNIRL